VLRKIFDKHGCDKGKRHGYEKVYEPALSQIREQPITLLEIGVFRGASLAAWAEYLPYATLIGLDTFERVQPGKIPEHPRVTLVQADSTEGVPDVLKGFRFDIIIDDGCHDPEAQLKTLENFLPLLKGGGRYFIEDAPTLRLGGAKVHDLTKGHAFDSRILELTA
jgi:cephalosporin hydroxylase